MLAPPAHAYSFVVEIQLVHPYCASLVSNISPRSFRNVFLIGPRPIHPLTSHEAKCWKSSSKCNTRRLYLKLIFKYMRHLAHYTSCRHLPPECGFTWKGWHWISNKNVYNINFQSHAKAETINLNSCIYIYIYIYIYILCSTYFKMMYIIYIDIVEKSQVRLILHINRSIK